MRALEEKVRKTVEWARRHMLPMETEADYVAAASMMPLETPYEDDMAFAADPLGAMFSKESQQVAQENARRRALYEQAVSDRAVVALDDHVSGGGDIPGLHYAPTTQQKIDYVRKMAQAQGKSFTSIDDALPFIRQTLTPDAGDVHEDEVFNFAVDTLAGGVLGPAASALTHGGEMLGRAAGEGLGAYFARQLGEEVASGLGGAAGMAVARQAAPDSVTAQIAGGLLGGAGAGGLKRALQHPASAVETVKGLPGRVRDVVGAMGERFNAPKTHPLASAVTDEVLESLRKDVIMANGHLDAKAASVDRPDATVIASDGAIYRGGEMIASGRDELLESILPSEAPEMPSTSPPLPLEENPPLDGNTGPLAAPAAPTEDIPPLGAPPAGAIALPAPPARLALSPGGQPGRAIALPAPGGSVVASSPGGAVLLPPSPEAPIAPSPRPPVSASVSMKGNVLPQIRGLRVPPYAKVKFDATKTRQVHAAVRTVMDDIGVMDGVDLLSKIRGNDGSWEPFFDQMHGDDVFEKILDRVSSEAGVPRTQLKSMLYSLARNPIDGYSITSPRGGKVVKGTAVDKYAIREEKGAPKLRGGERREGWVVGLLGEMDRNKVVGGNIFEEGGYKLGPDASDATRFGFTTLSDGRRVPVMDNSIVPNISDRPEVRISERLNEEPWYPDTIAGTMRYDSDGRPLPNDPLNEVPRARNVAPGVDLDAPGDYVLMNHHQADTVAPDMVARYMEFKDASGGISDEELAELVDFSRRWDARALGDPETAVKRAWIDGGYGKIDDAFYSPLVLKEEAEYFPGEYEAALDDISKQLSMPRQLVEFAMENINASSSHLERQVNLARNLTQAGDQRLQADAWDRASRVGAARGVVRAETAAGVDVNPEMVQRSKYGASTKERLAKESLEAQGARSAMERDARKATEIDAAKGIVAKLEAVPQSQRQAFAKRQLAMALRKETGLGGQDLSNELATLLEGDFGETLGQTVLVRAAKGKTITSEMLDRYARRFESSRRADEALRDLDYQVGEAYRKLDDVEYQQYMNRHLDARKGPPIEERGDSASILGEELPSPEETALENLSDTDYEARLQELESRITANSEKALADNGGKTPFVEPQPKKMAVEGGALEGSRGNKVTSSRPRQFKDLPSWEKDVLRAEIGATGDLSPSDFKKAEDALLYRRASDPDSLSFDERSASRRALESRGIFESRKMVPDATDTEKAEDSVRLLGSKVAERRPKSVLKRMEAKRKEDIQKLVREGIPEERAAELTPDHVKTLVELFDKPSMVPEGRRLEALSLVDSVAKELESIHNGKKTALPKDMIKETYSPGALRSGQPIPQGKRATFAGFEPSNGRPLGFLSGGLGNSTVRKTLPLVNAFSRWFLDPKAGISAKALTKTNEIHHGIDLIKRFGSGEIERLSKQFDNNTLRKVLHYASLPTGEKALIRLNVSKQTRENLSKFQDMIAPYLQAEFGDSNLSHLMDRGYFLSTKHKVKVSHNASLEFIEGMVKGGYVPSTSLENSVNKAADLFTRLTSGGPRSPEFSKALTDLERTLGTSLEDAPQFVKSILGDVTDPQTILSSNLSHIVDDVAQKRMVSQIFDLYKDGDRSVLSGKKIVGYRKIPDSVPEIGGMYAPKYIADRVSSNYRELGKLARLGSHVQTIFKKGKVFYNAGAYGRNFISNILLSEIGGVPLHYQVRTMPGVVKDLRAFSKTGKMAPWLEEAMEHGVLRGTMTAGDLNMLKKSLPAYDGVGESGFEGMLERVNRFMSSNRIGSAGEGAYEFIEDLSRLTAYRYYMEEGIPRGLVESVNKGDIFLSGKVKPTAKEAAEEVNKWLFDYSDVPEFVDAMRKSAVPFMTFPYFASKAICRAAKDGKVGLLSAFALVKGLQVAIEKGTGEHLNVDSIFPMWNVLTDGDEQRYGKSTTSKLTGAPNRAGELMDNFLPGGPVTLPFELAGNYSLFKGREIGDGVKGAKYAAKTLLPKTPVSIAEYLIGDREVSVRNILSDLGLTFSENTRERAARQYGTQIKDEIQAFRRFSKRNEGRPDLIEKRRQKSEKIIAKLRERIVSAGQK